MPGARERSSGLRRIADFFPVFGSKIWLKKEKKLLNHRVES
jgi:hypothetical protein